MQLRQSVASEEKSGILCPHIPSCHGASTKRQDSPALGSSHPSIPGRVNERVGRDGLQGVMVLRWEGRPHQTFREWYLSPPCDTNLLEVKGL